ncbi:hypothetical protein niasHT_010859 [Heterodera trifolii]|uniref:MARVEL domain-containing protein n=1 Tax=Heterodera trifolii TaxID=157864 RepID=A0ABD2LDD0_9BILA
MCCCNSCTNKWMCCCGCHVTSGSLVIAWLYLVSSLLTLPSAFSALVSQYHLVAFNLIHLTLTLLFCLSAIPIIVGEMCTQRTHHMYLPFLIINPVALIVALFAAIFAPSANIMSRVPNHRQHDAAAVFVATSMLFVLILSLNIWMYSIVYRAYQFVKRYGQEE